MFFLCIYKKNLLHFEGFHIPQCRYGFPPRGTGQHEISGPVWLQMYYIVIVCGKHVDLSPFVKIDKMNLSIVISYS